MLELNNDKLKFTFPEVHPDAELTITFHRTLRIPDDDKEYPLPPGLGAFPIRHVDDYRDRVPAKWIEHGGVMLPMYQAEALWMGFKSKHLPKHRAAYPFAVKIGTGKISAITGEDWQKGINDKDYIVSPEQPWIDGYKTGDNVVRQFVAAPLGWGFSAEEQITGKADHGGIQIEVFPMHRSIFDKKHPERPVISTTRNRRNLTLRSRVKGNGEAVRGVEVGADMGIGAGGRMKQEIYDDPHGRDCWRTEGSSRCFVHLANSLAWEAITEQKPPSTPVTAEQYTRHGYPWFDYYDDSQDTLKATDKLKGLKSILELGFQKGMNILPENISTSPENTHVVKGRHGQIRAGSW